MKYLAIASFLAGLLLWVRVMFFGVRRVDEERLYHRRWPLAFAAFFMVGGVLLYAVARNEPVTAGWVVVVVLISLAAAGGAAWLVQRSAAIPSTDPEDDPRYRFQGHVARIVEAINGTDRGRIAFVFDDRKHELRARWSPAADLPRDREAMGAVGAEVVIETVEGDLAYVEPWVLVEERL